MDPSDNELIEKSLEGDREAFSKLVERYRKRIYWVAFKMLHDHEDAKDISQEAFVRVHKSLHRFNLNQNFYTWLYQITVNLCIDHLRKYGKRNDVSLENLQDPGWYNDDPSQEARVSETALKVHTILDRLPPKYKIVLILRDFEELSCKKIAKIIGTTHATARWRLHQARKLFREEWDKVYPTPEEEESPQANPETT